MNTASDFFGFVAKTPDGLYGYACKSKMKRDLREKQLPLDFSVEWTFQYSGDSIETALPHMIKNIFGTEECTIRIE